MLREGRQRSGKDVKYGTHTILKNILKNVPPWGEK